MALEQDIALLSRVPIFSRLNKDALRLLAFSAETRNLEPRSVLFREGEISDSGYVVAEGGIALLRNDGQMAGDVIGPDRLIGELALITETFRPMTAVAQVSSTVLRVPRASFRRTLEEYPDLAQQLAADMRERIASLSNELSWAKNSFKKEA